MEEDDKKLVLVSGEPVYTEYHPCLHRWQRGGADSTLPKDLVEYRPGRINFLATPLARRLLELWLAHSYHMSPEMKERVLKMLLGFGFTQELLDAMLEAQRLERERLARIAQAGPMDVLDEDGYVIEFNPKRIPVKIKKKKSQKKRKVKKAKPKKTLKFEPGKRGQLKKGWPHKTGLRLMLLLLNIPHPNDDFISKASAYFDVQARALFDIVIKVFEQNEDNLIFPTALEEHVAIGCLNFCVWIAKNVIEPANLIQDDQIDECLAWKGQIPPKKKPPKQKSKKKKPSKNKSKKKKPSKNKSKKKKSKPKKIKKIKKKKSKKIEPKIEVSVAESFEDNPEEMESEPEEEEDFTDDLSENPQKTFFESSIWYNPLTPEFFLSNPATPEKLAEFEFFYDNLMWKLPCDDFDLQPMVPNKVPVFFQRLRPNLGCCVEPDDEIPWYIMTGCENYLEKKSEWDTAYTLETMEMITEMIKNMISIEKLSVSRLLEIVSKICDAIKINDADLATTPETERLDSKRTIIFQRIFIKFFSKKFRDYDGKTCDYMDTICRRAAVLVRLLYEHTSKELWNIQRSAAARPPTPEPEMEPEEEFDEEMFNNWNNWLEFLIKAQNDSKLWQQWLLDATESNELPDGDRTQLIAAADNWLELGQKTRDEAEVFKVNAEFLEPVPARPHCLENCQCEEENEESSENESEENEY